MVASRRRYTAPDVPWPIRLMSTVPVSTSSSASKQPESDASEASAAIDSAASARDAVVHMPTSYRFGERGRTRGARQGQAEFARYGRGGMNAASRRIRNTFLVLSLL